MEQRRCPAAASIADYQIIGYLLREDGMGLFWFIVGAIVGFFIAWYYLNQQCRSQLSDRDDEIARLRTQLASAKSKPEVAAKPAAAAVASEAKPSAGAAIGTSSAKAAATPDEKPSTSEPVGEPSSLLQAPSLNTEPDDLTRIKGIGRVLQAKLNELGIVTFQQIADFGQADIERVNEKLDFPGRIERERWVDQAKDLAKKG
jgi:predicted flap endonuclease-1-like 5' DNA nuclease